MIHVNANRGKRVALIVSSCLAHSRRPTVLPSASRSLRVLALTLPAWLAACGGGSDGPVGAASCSVPDEQAFLSSYFDDNYFWYRLSPKPAPASFSTTAAYFDALLYRGGDAIPNGGGATWPSDRYSNFQSTASFNSFFGDGQTLSYGLAVAGLEAAGQANAPLYVRYLEPAGPAAQAGVVRGERIMSLNGRPASDIIIANDFSALTPNAAGDALDVVLRNTAGQDRSVRLTAATFNLTPVQNGLVVLSPVRRVPMGYVFIKDMISQAEAPLRTAMASFKTQGVQEVVLDLRYNGGGLVSTGGTVASYAAGNRGAGQTYASLLYNDKQSGNNQTYTFGNPNAWAGFSKVYVLMGERTCSASEQVVNGLRGVGVDAVLIGDTTCGKPVGFLPRDNACGSTYSVVNFESVNARSEGRYFDGFTPTCAVAEDFSKQIGAFDDPLLVTAAAHVDGGACPVALTRETPSARSTAGSRARYNGADGGERSGMSAR
jgi:carboxyl-terminal processing protease